MVAILQTVKCDISVAIQLIFVNPNLMGNQKFENLKILDGGWRSS